MAENLTYREALSGATTSRVAFFSGAGGQSARAEQRSQRSRAAGPQRPVRPLWAAFAAGSVRVYNSATVHLSRNTLVAGVSIQILNAKSMD